MERLTIHFLATGDIALPTLNYLLEAPNCRLLSLITQPDKPAGRKLQLAAPQVKTIAQAAGIPVHQPERLRDFASFFKDQPADIILVMAYGQILRRNVLNSPRLACLNLHASLLPRHRGASCLQAAIRDGDSASGITVMHMAPGLDTGDIICQRKITLTPDETGGSLHDHLAILAPLALNDALALLSQNSPPRQPQDESLATYAPRLHREDGVLDFSQPADFLARMIRAYEPWPGTSTTLPDGSLLKLFPPTEFDPQDSGHPPGTILPDTTGRLAIACGSGILFPGEIQKEGKRRMSVTDFLRSGSIKPGEKLGHTPIA
jgi:methionyl-tRNA formyltransferase